MGILKHAVLPVLAIGHAFQAYKILTEGKDALPAYYGWPGSEEPLTPRELHMMGVILSISLTLMVNCMAGIFFENAHYRGMATVLELIFFSLEYYDAAVNSAGFPANANSCLPSMLSWASLCTLWSLVFLPRTRQKPSPNRRASRSEGSSLLLFSLLHQVSVKKNKFVNRHIRIVSILSIALTADRLLDYCPSIAGTVVLLLHTNSRRDFLASDSWNILAPYFAGILLAENPPKIQTLLASHPGPGWTDRLQGQTGRLPLLRSSLSSRSQG